MAKPKKKRKVRKLADFVAGEKALCGKATSGSTPGFQSGQPYSSGPQPYDAIPDYSEIYYQPEEDPRREDETNASTNRRKAMGFQNKGKFGFHGTADAEDTPLLHYQREDFAQDSAPDREPEKTSRDIITPNKYPQPKLVGKIGKMSRPIGGQHTTTGVRFNPTSNETSFSHKPKKAKPPPVRDAKVKFVAQRMGS